MRNTHCGPTPSSSASRRCSWLVAAEVFRLVYPAARRGRKVAYLTLASFVFLVIALASFTLLDTVHGTTHRDMNVRRMTHCNCGLRIADCGLAEHSHQSEIRNPKSEIEHMNNLRSTRDGRLQPQAYQPGGPRAACVHARTSADALAAWRVTHPDQEAVLISTCNRVELYAAAADPTAQLDPPALTHFLDRFPQRADRGSPPGTNGRSKANDVVRHLFRVAASLDSMVVGEAQILRR